MTEASDKNSSDPVRELPQPFQNPEFRFLIVKARSKKPEETWKDPATHLQFDDPKLLKHLGDGGNVGMLGGYGGLVIIDCDRQELVDQLNDKLPRTFMERSAKGLHFFYICKNIDYYQSLDIRDVNGETMHYGEIRADREHQTVVTPSIHETGAQYSAITFPDGSSLPIAEVSLDLLIEAVKPFLQPTINWDEKKKSYDGYPSFSLQRILNVENFRQIKQNEYQGRHPVHDSTTGVNFTFNTDKNLWHCFRDNCGGTALHLIGQLEGIIKCGEGLDGKSFIDVAKIAETKYGFDVVSKMTQIEAAKDVELFVYLEDLGIPEPITWLVPRYIPSKGVTILSGDTGTGKSLIAAEMSSAILNKRKLFGEFEITSNRPVILIDMENDHSTLYDRIKKLGGVPAKSLVVFRFDENFDIMDSRCLKQLDQKVQAINPCLVVFDTLRRTYSGDENDSRIINIVYKQMLSPLAKDRCCLVLAHNRKRSTSKNAVFDDLSEIRGTGDITGIASAVIALKRNANGTLTLKPVKLRCGNLPDAFTLNIDKTDTSLKLRYIGIDTEALEKQVSSENRLMEWLKENSEKSPLFKTSEMKEAMRSFGYENRAGEYAIRALKERGYLIPAEGRKRGKFKFVLGGVNESIADFTDEVE